MHPSFFANPIDPYILSLCLEGSAAYSIKYKRINREALDGWTL